MCWQSLNECHSRTSCFLGKLLLVMLAGSALQAVVWRPLSVVELATWNLISLESNLTSVAENLLGLRHFNQSSCCGILFCGSVTQYAASWPEITWTSRDVYGVTNYLLIWSAQNLSHWIVAFAQNRRSIATL